MSKINEQQINPSDVKAVFRAAEDSRKNQGFMRNTFSRLKKDDVSAKDLQQSWKEDGFPDDIRDIKRILKDHGFGDKEITKVLTQVFGGTKKGYEEPVASAAIQKIADYAKKNGIEQELIKFLERDYGFGNKAVTEQIRDIFTNIVQEERTERARLLKEYEHTQLGRSRK